MFNLKFAIGVIVGIIANIYFNRLSENRIIKALTEQIQQLKDKQAVGKITPEEQIRISGLEEALRILKNK